jgi:hypothetical protein
VPRGSRARGMSIHSAKRQLRQTIRESDANGLCARAVDGAEHVCKSMAYLGTSMGKDQNSCLRPLPHALSSFFRHCWLRQIPRRCVTYAREAQAPVSGGEML